MSAMPAGAEPNLWMMSDARRAARRPRAGHAAGGGVDEAPIARPDTARAAGDDVTEQRRALPDQPGVYLFRDADEQGDLRRQGALDPQAGRPATSPASRRAGVAMRRQIALDRLPRHRDRGRGAARRAAVHQAPPARFNIRLRDDKSYPYIGISLDEEFPRVYFTRERHRSARLYFGPYSTAKRVRETLDLLGKLFQYRTCEGPEPGRRSGVPCLDYYIKRCAAPCVGYVDREEYRRNIDAIVDFLSGRYRDVERDLERKMAEAADAEEFERAAVFRDRLERRALADGAPQRRRRVVRQRRPDRRRGRGRGGQRAGLPGPRRRSSPSARASTSRTRRERDEAEVTEEFLAQYYSAAPSMPRLVVVGDGAARPRRRCSPRRSRSARGGPVEVRVAERGDEAPPARARRAQRPARARPGPACAASAAAQQRVDALAALQDGAGDERAAGPDRGLRHLQHRRRAHGRLDGGLRGRGAEEVRLPPVPIRGTYRNPNAPEGPDDFASMEEVLSRRVAPAARAVRPLAARRRARRELRRPARPDRDRRRQGPARGRDEGAGAAASSAA